jgi:hypothetical protein
MMGGLPMPHPGSIRHGQSFSEIPLVYDYQVKKRFRLAQPYP